MQSYNQFGGPYYQNKVNQLELQSALNGVVRYPNSFAYNAGANPFCACGCNGYNGNI